jgi:hypothetical protein
MRPSLYGIDTLPPVVASGSGGGGGGGGGPEGSAVAAGPYARRSGEFQGRAGALSPKAARVSGVSTALVAHSKRSSHTSHASVRSHHTGASGGSRASSGPGLLPPVEMVVVPGVRHWSDPYPAMHHRAQLVSQDFDTSARAVEIRKVARA